MSDYTCAVCSVAVGGPGQLRRFHIDHADYCEKHKPAPRPGVWDDSVRGFVIGGEYSLTHYKFMRDGKLLHSGNYYDDREAIDDFKRRYPEEYAAGCEIRVYNQ